MCVGRQVVLVELTVAIAFVAAGVWMENILEDVIAVRLPAQGLRQQDPCVSLCWNFASPGSPKHQP